MVEELAELQKTHLPSNFNPKLLFLQRNQYKEVKHELE